MSYPIAEHHSILNIFLLDGLLTQLSWFEYLNNKAQLTLTFLATSSVKAI